MRTDASIFSPIVRVQQGLVGAVTDGCPPDRTGSDAGSRGASGDRPLRGSSTGCLRAASPSLCSVGRPTLMSVQPGRSARGLAAIVHRLRSAQGDWQLDTRGL